jgi:hypothetical protein
MVDVLEAMLRGALDALDGGDRSQAHRLLRPGLMHAFRASPKNHDTCELLHTRHAGPEGMVNDNPDEHCWVAECNYAGHGSLALDRAIRGKAGTHGV